MFHRVLNTSMGRDTYNLYPIKMRKVYGIKLYMPCKSSKAYLMGFIVYTGATTGYPEPMEDLSKPFEDYSNPSKTVLSLM